MLASCSSEIILSLDLPDTFRTRRPVRFVQLEDSPARCAPFHSSVGASVVPVQKTIERPVRQNIPMLSLYNHALRIEVAARLSPVLFTQS